VQDEISSIIVNKCRENLTAKEHEEKLVKVPTQNLEAYTLFLKGLHFFNKISPKNVKKAIEFFEKAITLEPDYAYAYAMAAESYAFLGSTGQMQPNEAFDVVHRYSDKALLLDSSLSAGYAAKGSAFLLYDWKWKEAYDSLLRAIELNPLSPIVHKSLADAYIISGRADDALKQVEFLLDMHPQMRIALELKGWCYGAKGDWKKAAEIFEEVHRSIKHPLKGLAPLGCAYANLGEVEKASECIRKIEQWQSEEPGVVVDADLAMIWLSLGEMDKAFHHLFQCVDKRMGPVAIIIEHPMFKVPADDPRYKLLKEKLKLEEYY